MTIRPTQVFPEPFKRMLLVEGADDKSFFLSLAKHLKVNETIWIYEYGGKDHLDDALIAVVNDARFELLEHLGIVRDADFNTDAFSSIRSQINSANHMNSRNQLPLPERNIEPVGTTPKVSVSILPDHGVEGMLENLILQAYSDDSAMLCVDDYFLCLENKGLSPKPQILPKAKARVFIAAKAVDSLADRKTSEAWELQYIFRLNWWSWNSPVFDSIKSFLQQLVTV